MSSNKGKGSSHKSGGKPRSTCESSLDSPRAGGQVSAGPRHSNSARPSSSHSQYLSSLHDPSSLHALSSDPSSSPAPQSTHVSSADATIVSTANCGLPTSSAANLGLQPTGDSSQHAPSSSEVVATGSSSALLTSGGETAGVASQALAASSVEGGEREATAASLAHQSQAAVVSLPLCSAATSGTATVPVSAGVGPIPSASHWAGPTQGFLPFGMHHPQGAPYPGPQPHMDPSLRSWQSMAWWMPQMAPWQQPPSWGLAPSPAPLHPSGHGSFLGGGPPGGFPQASPTWGSPSGMPTGFPPHSGVLTPSQGAGQSSGPSSSTTLGASAFAPLQGRRDTSGDSPRLSSTPVSPEPDRVESSGEEEEEEEDPISDQQHWSFADSVSLLASFAPSAVGEKAELKVRSLSAAERALGSTPQPSSSSQVLKESQMVGDAIIHAQEQVRGSCAHPEVPPGSVPDFPGALPCGKFLKPEKLPFSRGPPLARNVIPEAPLSLSQEDLLLLPERSRSAARHTTLSDRTLSEWEDMARRGLEAVSVMDSFLGGLVDSLRDPSSDQAGLAGFHIRQDLDPQAILSLIMTVAQGLRFSASSFARLHLNAILARRDSVLLASAVTQSGASRASLRALPVKGGSLFGHHVQATIKSQADIRRDLALNEGQRRPAKRSPASFPSSTSPRPPKVRREGRHTGARGRARRRPSQGPRAQGANAASPKPSHPQ